MELFNAPLRYRFDHLDQARAHVVRAGDHSLFFFRHPRLSLEPGSSVQMEWTFQNAEPARMLHGTPLENVDRCGLWMELHDTRPLRELRSLHNVRRHRRMATDRPVQIAWSGRVEGGYRFVMPWIGGVGVTPYAAGCWLCGAELDAQRCQRPASPIERLAARWRSR